MSETHAQVKRLVIIEKQVLDNDGKPVLLWQENRLGQFIREKLGKDIQGPRFLGQWTTTMRDEIKWPPS